MAASIEYIRTLYGFNLEGPGKLTRMPLGNPIDTKVIGTLKGVKFRERAVGEMYMGNSEVYLAVYEEDERFLWGVEFRHPFDTNLNILFDRNNHQLIMNGNAHDMEYSHLASYYSPLGMQVNITWKFLNAEAVDFAEKTWRGLKGDPVDIRAGPPAYMYSFAPFLPLVKGEKYTFAPPEKIDQSINWM